MTVSGDTIYGEAFRGGNLSLNGGNGGGTVFSVPLSSGNATVLAAFNGSNGQFPVGGLTLVGNSLYGTTQNGGAYGGTNGYGTVFSVPLSGGSATVLASFSGSNGIAPGGGLTLSGSTFMAQPKVAAIWVRHGLQPSRKRRHPHAAGLVQRNQWMFPGKQSHFSSATTLYGTAINGGSGDQRRRNGLQRTRPAAATLRALLVHRQQWFTCQ